MGPHLRQRLGHGRGGSWCLVSAHYAGAGAVPLLHTQKLPNHDGRSTGWNTMANEVALFADRYACAMCEFLFHPEEGGIMILLHT